MRKPRKLETPEERTERLRKDVEVRRAAMTANEAAVDRMIRRSIEQHGP